MPRLNLNKFRGACWSKCSAVSKRTVDSDLMAFLSELQSSSFDQFAESKVVSFDITRSFEQI